MAKTTCKKFTYAKYSSGGDGSAIVYTGGTMLDDYLAKVDITEDRTDEKEYADGHLIDSEKIPTASETLSRTSRARRSEVPRFRSTSAKNRSNRPEVLFLRYRSR